jgi:hypothetical protein
MLLAPWGGFAAGETIEVDPLRLRALLKSKLVERPAKPKAAA